MAQHRRSTFRVKSSVSLLLRHYALLGGASVFARDTEPRTRLGQHNAAPQMRNKQVCGNGNWREERTVSLTRLGVKSSGEQQQCARRRRALSRLVAAAGSENRRQQMAGESGERKRLPKRQVQGGGRGDEKSIENLNEGDKIQAEPLTHKERRGKENDAGKVAPAVAGKMEEDAALSGATGQTDPSVFFDEDSNHIFPVEQFFGNLNTVQDFSHKVTAMEGMSRREYRRRHYYAKEEDSDEEQT